MPHQKILICSSFTFKNNFHEKPNISAISHGYSRFYQKYKKCYKRKKKYMQAFDYRYFNATHSIYIQVKTESTLRSILNSTCAPYRINNENMRTVFDIVILLKFFTGRAFSGNLGGQNKKNSCRQPWWRPLTTSFNQFSQINNLVNNLI